MRSLNPLHRCLLAAVALLGATLPAQTIVDLGSSPRVKRASDSIVKVDPNAPVVRLRGVGPDHQAQPIPDDHIVPRDRSQPGGGNVVRLRDDRRPGARQLLRPAKPPVLVDPGLRVRPDGVVLQPGHGGHGNRHDDDLSAGDILNLISGALNLLASSDRPSPALQGLLDELEAVDGTIAAYEHLRDLYLRAALLPTLPAREQQLERSDLRAAFLDWIAPLGAGTPAWQAERAQIRQLLQDPGLARSYYQATEQELQVLEQQRAQLIAQLRSLRR